MKITLREPLERRSAATGQVVDRVEEVTFRRPRAGDMAAALDACGGDKSKVGSMMNALSARCTGLSLADFNELSPEDWQEIMEHAAGFLGSGLKTGPTPSPLSAAPSGSPAGSGGPPPSSAS